MTDKDESQDKSEKIRENIKCAPHPAERDDGDGHIAYTARLLYEVGSENESVANALKHLQNNPNKQIEASARVSEAVESADPKTEDEISDLALSGAFWIRSCRYAAAAIHGIVDHDEE